MHLCIAGREIVANETTTKRDDTERMQGKYYIQTAIPYAAAMWMDQRSQWILHI